MVAGRGSGSPKANLGSMRWARGARFLVFSSVVPLMMTSVAPGSAGTRGSARTIVLEAGAAHIWGGPFVEQAGGPVCRPGNCWSYTLYVKQAALRLRVGIDHLDHHDAFALELRDPGDRLVATSEHRFLETPEIAVEEPQPGPWTLRVVAQEVRRSSFTLRAKLERDLPAPPVDRPAPPNLRAEPGFDFGFTAPIGSNYGIVELPVSTSCHPDESAEDVVVRCLRFSFGYQNAGDGPLDLHFDPLTDVATRTTRVRQRIYVGDDTPRDYSDNRYRESPAGTATYHEVHGHYHYDAVFQARVFRVVDLDDRKSVPLGEAAKRGTCAHDWVLVDFERFYQDLAGTADSGTDCNFGFTDPTSTRMRIGLSRGWADIYTAELSDNYVEFPQDVDGVYLVRVWADLLDRIVESNEEDNAAYSLIRIEGNAVTLLERGRGTAPWDPTRMVLRGLGD